MSCHISFIGTHFVYHIPHKDRLYMSLTFTKNKKNGEKIKHALNKDKTRSISLEKNQKKMFHELK